MALMPTAMHCQGQIVTYRRPWMAGSVTKARSHDESSGGRSVTGVHGSVPGKQQKCNCRHGNATSRHSHGGMASSGHGILDSWACEANYKINDQPIHEGVMARVVIIHVVNHFMNTRNYVVFIIPNIVLWYTTNHINAFQVTFQNCSLNKTRFLFLFTSVNKQE